MNDRSKYYKNKIKQKETEDIRTEGMFIGELFIYFISFSLILGLLIALIM